MLRKLIALAITAGLAKRAWNQYRASQAMSPEGKQPPVGTVPPVTPGPRSVDVATSTAKPVSTESLQSWH